MNIHTANNIIINTSWSSAYPSRLTCFNLFNIMMIVNPRLCCGKTFLRTMNIDILIFMIIIMIVLIFMVVSGQTRPPPI